MSNPEKPEKEIPICDNKSVGMLIWKDGKLLLIERKRSPFGYAPPAGHVDDKGSYKNAAIEETEEEVGLSVVGLKQLIEGEMENPCRRPGGTWHYWKIYEVRTEGEVKPSQDETKQAGWFSMNELKKLAQRTEEYVQGKISEQDWEQSPGLIPGWVEWFQKLSIL